jgi:hypothetical protein
MTIKDEGKGRKKRLPCNNQIFMLSFAGCNNDLIPQQVQNGKYAWDGVYIAKDKYSEYAKDSMYVAEGEYGKHA